MGRGYWLNPSTQQTWIVDKHELWVLENSLLSGVPSDVHAHLLSLDQNKGMDEIRLAAINAGLIRLRDRRSHVSVQFSADQLNQKYFLRSVAMFLDEIVVFKDTPLVIGNFATRTETTMTLRQLLKEVLDDTLDEELRDKE